MNRIIRRVGILFVIFAAALLLYFFGNREMARTEGKTYVAFQDATLPVVRAVTCGRAMNRMAGYVQDVDNSAAGELLTVLPQDRALPILIEDGGDPVTAVSYEIRSLDRQRLIERTVVEQWDRTEDGSLQAVLPIQNLLNKEQEYLLCIELKTEARELVRYYTRIVWTDGEIAQPAVEFALSFSAKTFDPDQARSLVTYMETSPAEDNSSFGRTTIRSSFANLTWEGLGMKPEGAVQASLKALDGSAVTVSLNYLTSRSSGEGETAVWYEVTESFTMRWSQLRIYLMDYERTVDQIFQGNSGAYAGKRILLGITNDDRVEVQKSDSQTVLAYRVNRDLWSYQESQRKAVQVFSFRGRNLDDVRDGYSQHDIKILSVDDSGDLDFLVYGYMNKGNHEGQMGVAGYHYSAQANALDELFFTPYAGCFQALKEDVDRLACKNSIGMLYLYLDHAIYGIDWNSGENMVVAEDLLDGGWAASGDQMRVAWQDGETLDESETLHLMDLESGETQEIGGGSGEYVRVLGFVSRDLVYGTARESDRWVVNGRTQEFPMYGIRIVNDQMQVETSYEKSGYYISSVVVEQSRIHLNRIVWTDQGYGAAEEDIIVCNDDIGSGPLDGIGWYASQDSGKIYFVQLSASVGGRVEVTAPGEVSYDQAAALQRKAGKHPAGMEFYAYGSGELQKITMDFSEAVQLAYDRMGYVTDSAGNVIWSRINRGSARTIRDLQTAFAPMLRHLEGFESSQVFEDGIALLDARGCSMQQLLYFIDQGMPVIGYTENGAYLLLYGYDAYNVMVYNPDTGEGYKAGLNDSTEFFRVRGNDFVVALQTGK